ncbi:SXL [Symbiodinium microadriaticum]|nr:SXL [Symbiodinium sp. KB8]CAE7881306.1 SXL [Symbiodinium microadriaticum]
MALPPRGGPPSEDLFVTGLPMDCTAVQAKQIFQQYGGVKQANVLPVAAGKTAAAAFVIMNSVEDAKWVIDNVNGNVPQGLSNPVTVSFATPRTQRPAGGKGMKGDGTGMPPEMMKMMTMLMSAMGGKGGGSGDAWGSESGGGGKGSAWGGASGGGWEKGAGGWGGAGGGWGGDGGWGSGGGYGKGYDQYKGGGKGWGGGMW